MKEKIYIIFKNNEEEYDDYSDWIIETYKDKEKAENRFVELVKTNHYKKDRAIRKAKYNEDIGAYRIEKHEIENETRQNEVIDTNASSIEEDIARIEKIITTKFNNDYSIDNKDKEALEHILSDYKRVLKENEELKEYIVIAPNLDEMTATKYRNIQQDAYIKGRAEEQQRAEQIIYENYIPIQKVKDKIEELNDISNTEELEDIMNRKNYTITELVQYILQELLERK